MQLIDPPPNGIQRASPPPVDHGSHADQAILVLREQVKEALRSLAHHKIRYNELVGEGVDPYLLQNLYQDLDKKPVHEKLFSPIAGVERVSETAKAVLRSAPTVDLQDTLVNSPSPQPQQPSITKNITSSSTPIKSTPIAQARAHTAEPSQPTIFSAISTEKSPVAPTSSNVAMERKDRIAQLLAAKTGKAIPPRPALEKQAEPSVENGKSVFPFEAVNRPPALPEKPPVPSPEPVIKPKNKAQTELIRLKMEALKKEALAKSQVPSTMKASLSGPSDASIIPSPAARPQQLVGSEEAVRNGSGGLEFQIPGLFMTSETYPDAPNGTYRELESPQSEIKVDDRIEINSTAVSITQDNTTGSENDLVRSAVGQTLPVRVPQKRPLASDSFDEQLPSLKRPFGRKASYDKVEILVSDAESEGEVEDVEMELDEESDDEKQLARDVVAPPLSLRDRNIRDLPPLTDFPSPKASVQFSSGVGTPTSAVVHTPGKEKDKEDLWKAKHQEIELMRKKIAEMEERRKAKQNIPRSNSPSVVAKAPMPVIRTSLARPSQPPSSRLATPPVAARAESSSDMVPPPVLAISKPEELPWITSTAIKEPIKEPQRAEDLRQKLLKKQTTREGTPIAAEIELRQAQLAEKREKLAALRREAERHEAEILEEANLLEAQLQAELDGPDADEGAQSTLSDNLEAVSNASDQRALDTLPQRPPDAPIATIEGSPGAVMFRPNFLPDRPSQDAANSGNLTDDDIHARRSEKGSSDEELAVSEPKVSSVSSNFEAIPDLREEFSEVDQLVMKTAMPPTVGSFAVPTTAPDRPSAKSPSPVSENHFATETGLDTIGNNLADDDGSVSMSDSASEDYEPAEPEQIRDDQPETNSELYEPADVTVPVDTIYQSMPMQNEIGEPAKDDQLITKISTQPPNPTAEKRDPSPLIDDAEDGMRLTESDIINQPQIFSQSHEPEADNKVRGGTSLPAPSNMYHYQVPPAMSHFTPYKTPRSYFKNFRYYDQFPEIVPSGYKSLTFSNNIDPRRPFCATDLSGQACEDPTCQEQHFRQVVMTGACNGSSQSLYPARSLDSISAQFSGSYLNES